jgi:uridine monophosphate synthetase
VKTHGTERFIEGSYRPGEQVLVVDDVISRAQSKFEAIDLLETVQLQVRDIFVVVDRQMGGTEYLAEQGYTVHAVMTIQDVLDTLLALDRITYDQHQFITAWLEESRSTNRNVP